LFISQKLVQRCPVSPSIDLHALGILTHCLF
jgi:hypothetical protein